MNITREQARALVAHGVDDALQSYLPSEVPSHSRVRYVGYAAGFEPMVVAVWSYLPECEVDDEEAADLATDLLIELKWFGGGMLPNPIFIL